MQRTERRNADARLPGLVLLILLPLLLGCGSEEGGGGGAPQITFAASLLPVEQAQYDAILEDFTSLSGIEVRLVAVQYAQIRSSVEAEALAGRGKLDLVELDLPQLPVMRKLMLPLDDITSGMESLRAAVPAGAWEVTTAPAPAGTSRLLFLPHRLNWQAMVYDGERIPEPPGTWEELLLAAEANTGAIGLKCARYEGLVCDVFPFIWQAGGDPLRPATPEVARAMEFLRELGKHLNAAATSYQENSIHEAQVLREIALHFNWPFVVPLLRDKKLLPSPMKIAPLPAGPAGRATVLGGGYLGIPASAPHPREAARLMEYLTSVEGQRALVRSLGWFPIREEAWGAMSEADRELYRGFLEMRNDVRARPSIPDYDALSRQWQETAYQILFQDGEIEASLRTLQAMIDQLDVGG